MRGVAVREAGFFYSRGIAGPSQSESIYRVLQGAKSTFRIIYYGADPEFQGPPHSFLLRHQRTGFAITLVAFVTGARKARDEIGT